MSGTLPSESVIPPHKYGDDIESIVISTEDIQTRVKQLAVQTAEHYKDSDRELILVCVLKGAIMFLADFSRELPIESQMEFMAVSSYGSSTSSSGVVRILKDLDRDIRDKDVLIVEDIIDSGLTLSWLLKNLGSRGPHSLNIVSLLRKPDSVKVDLDVLAVGFDIPSTFIVGYGLDYGERYRDLGFIGTLKPELYS